jgi:hypothetical protein
VDLIEARPQMPIAKPGILINMSGCRKISINKWPAIGDGPKITPQKCNFVSPQYGHLVVKWPENWEMVIFWTSGMEQKRGYEFPPSFDVKFPRGRHVNRNRIFGRKQIHWASFAFDFISVLKNKFASCVPTHRVAIATTPAR